MNTHMWDSPFTGRHLNELDTLGVKLIEPISKKLACGDIGNGAMAEPSRIVQVARSVTCGCIISSLEGLDVAAACKPA